MSHMGFLQAEIHVHRSFRMRLMWLHRKALVLSFRLAIMVEMLTITLRICAMEVSVLPLPRQRARYLISATPEQQSTLRRQVSVFALWALVIFLLMLAEPPSLHRWLLAPLPW